MFILTVVEEKPVTELQPELTATGVSQAIAPQKVERFRVTFEGPFDNKKAAALTNIVMSAPRKTRSDSGRKKWQAQ